MEHGTSRCGKRRWSDLGPAQQATVLALGSLQVSLALTAWIDLANRPPELVRGRKRTWAALIAINAVGPVLYFTRGALPPHPDAGAEHLATAERGSGPTAERTR